MGEAREVKGEKRAEEMDGCPSIRKKALSRTKIS
jgi:hypothetical protein